MSNFSPRIYQVSSFKEKNFSNPSEYFNYFTLLDKPVKRNVYKISLAHMLHYMINFGIGYDSVCVTTLTTQQQFDLGRYVNRHGSTSVNRPATVADLKEKILKIVDTLVDHAVSSTNNGLLRRTNTIYPTYILTLDTEITPSKLKDITYHDYVELDDFSDFLYSGPSAYEMPKYSDGYVPLSAVKTVPLHSHDPHKDIRKAMSFSGGAKLKPAGKSIWYGHGSKIWLCGKHENGVRVETGGNGTKPGTFQKHNTVELSSGGRASCSVSYSWETPTGAECAENAEKDPVNTKGGKLSIRYPGRRYRIFKRIDQ